MKDEVSDPGGKNCAERAKGKIFFHVAKVEPLFLEKQEPLQSKGKAEVTIFYSKHTLFNLLHTGNVY